MTVHTIIADDPHRVILAFERLTPLQVCARFSRGVGRPVRYIHGPIRIEVNIPTGYREHLEALEETLGDKRAPYFGPSYEYPNEARSLWEGHRGIEEYAREVFPLEEAANGLTWMDDTHSEGGATDIDDADAGGTDSLGTSLSRSFIHVPGIKNSRALPEGEASDFFVGSC